MSRQEKKTRIRVVPPKLQLRGQDALTGSYPTNVRFSTDGRTGNYKVGYNDVQTIVFGTGSFGTSWQDNLVAYWTMQRNIPNTGYASNFALESETADKNSTFPFLDFELADDPIVSGIDQYGFIEEFAFSGKGYNVNINEGQPTDNIIFPIPEVNKSYEFYPKYSVFGLTETKFPITNPLLVQNQDSNKTACAFDGNWNDGPSAFTVAGWFKINDIIGESNGWTLLKGPQRSNVTFDVDYAVGIYSPNPNEKKFYIYVNSGSVAIAYIEQNGVYNDSSLLGNWFHITITYDGKTDRAPNPDPKGTIDSNSLKIYINGEKLATDPISVFGGFNGFNSGSFPTYGVGFLEYWYGGLGNQQITGSIAEAAFFNRELTSSEIAEIYYSRVPLNKKRRIIAGTSIDFDNDPYPVDAGEYMTTFNRDGMLVTGSIVKGVGDNPEWVHFSPGQEMQPFHDEQQFAADAKGAVVQNPFFATGSAETLFGEGFNSPLWSKNKIEIPIPVVADTELNTYVGEAGSGFATTQKSPMAYYNFAKNVWEPIGIGLPLNVSSEREDYYDNYPIGFPQSLGIFGQNLTINVVKNIAYCTDGLGFPFHPKYHASSSQTLDMSQYITEPFLLEKAVLELGSIQFSINKLDDDFLEEQSPVSSSVTTFFLLNQRFNQSMRYTKNHGFGGVTYNTFVDLPKNQSLTKNDYDAGILTRVDTLRDVIGFSQIFCVSGQTPLDEIILTSYNTGQKTGSLAELLPITSNDILIRTKVSSFPGVQYGISPVFSMSMCTPTFGENLIGINILACGSDSNLVFTFGNDGYRNGLGMLQPTTRGFVNDLFNSPNLESELTNLITDNKITFPTEKFRINPYVLYPQDKIILGCQMPISLSPSSLVGDNVPGSEGTLKIKETVTTKLSPKLTLYGSYIRGNKEYNDGTNQLLSSETIHEVIE